MAIDLLSLIGTVYRDRLGREELAQRSRESAADRALRESMQGREFEFQGKESAAERALREKLEAERLGLTRSANEMEQLSGLSQLLGRGATNIPQADVLSMLARRFGVPVNTAQLRNAGRTSTATAGAGGRGAGSDAFAPAFSDLGSKPWPHTPMEYRGFGWKPLGPDYYRPF